MSVVLVTGSAGLIGAEAVGLLKPCGFLLPNFSEMRLAAGSRRRLEMEAKNLATT